MATAAATVAAPSVAAALVTADPVAVFRYLKSTSILFHPKSFCQFVNGESIHLINRYIGTETKGSTSIDLSF